MFCVTFLFSVNETDFASYADDNIPYVTGYSIEDVINSPENVSVKLFKWFAGNQMKANKDQCHLLVTGSENITINVDGSIIGKSICEKLLGVNVDYKLKFSERLDSVLKNVGQKVNALSRILKKKPRILMNSFFTSQFNYCPLIWIY